MNVVDIQQAQPLPGQHNGHRANFDVLYETMGRYVAKQQSCTFAELFELFGEGERDHTNEKKFFKRLATAQARGLLVKVGSDKARLYVPPASAKLYGADGQLKRATATAPAYDLMRAPVWVPPRAMPLRPGCQDFLNLRSLGHRC